MELPSAFLLSLPVFFSFPRSFCPGIEAETPIGVRPAVNKANKRFVVVPTVVVHTLPANRK